MNILVITDAYPPEIRSAAVLMSQLATGLCDLGHSVTVLTCYPEYNLTPEARRRFADISCLLSNPLRNTPMIISPYGFRFVWAPPARRVNFTPRSPSVAMPSPLPARSSTFLVSWIVFALAPCSTSKITNLLTSPSLRNSKPPKWSPSDNYPPLIRMSLRAQRSNLKF